MWRKWNIRRLRIGPRITLFRRLTFHTEVELDPQRHDPFYVRLTDVYVQWTKKRAVRGHRRQTKRAVHARWRHLIARAADHRQEQSREQHLVSSGISPGRERVRAARAVGVSRGHVFVGRHEQGVRRVQRRGSQRSASSATTSRRSSASREALLTGNYVYQNPDPDNTFTRELEHIGSVNFRFEQPKWGARADLSTADGIPRPRRHVGAPVDAIRECDGQISGRWTLHLHRQRRSQRHPPRNLREPTRHGPRRSSTRSGISAQTTTSTATG